MAGIRSLFAKLGFTDDDEMTEGTVRDTETEEEEEEEDEEEEEEEQSRFRMPFNFGSLFGRGRTQDEEDDEEEEDESEETTQTQASASSRSQNGRVIDYGKKSKERRNGESSASSGAVHSEHIFVVRSLGDSRSIITHLHDGDSVILNLENIDPKDCGRVIDLLSGAAFALGGSITKVSRLTYLLAPNNIRVVPPQNPAGATRFTL